jgi:outer membrane protein assembly factor BamB
VYVFFGKTGVLAFDLDGKRLWQTSVGTGSGARGWGTASSPIVHENLVIVTAAAESESVVALNKETGEEVWKQEAGSLYSTWGTPILVDTGKDQVDLVLAVPYEIWGSDPNTGKLRWYCESYESDSLCTSAIAHDGIVYVVGGRNGGSIAVRAAGGSGGVDVTKTHVLWTGGDRARISTPICYEGRLYWVAGGVANCIDAKTGQRVYQSRLERATAATGPGAKAKAAPPGPGGGRRRPGGFGRGGGGFGGQDYASPVVADGKLYFVTRSGEVFVLALGPKFQQLARNRFESDGGDFSATPAVSNGELFIRSSRNLYCVAELE